MFTKLLKPIAAFLKTRYSSYPVFRRYANYRLLCPRDNPVYSNNGELLTSLRFTIHKEKLITTATQIITFLGFTINSYITRQISLPPEKVTRTLTLCRQILAAEMVSLRLLAKLLGLLEPYRQAIWKAPVHFSHLQAQLIQDLQKHNHQYNVRTSLTQASKTKLKWWLTNLQQVNGSQIVAPPPHIVIFTDASKKGWGAICNNIRTNGKWSFQEGQLHINLVELKERY